MNSKYLIVSDNHGNLNTLKNIIKKFRDEIDGIVHCGDVEFSLSRLEDFAGCPVYGARGNCDYSFDRDPEALFELGDHHVAFVTHGDHYGVNWEYDMLLERGAEMGADVIFYGHTHRPAFTRLRYDDTDYVIMNPGSTDLPRQFQPNGPTFAILDVGEDGSLTPQYYLIDWRHEREIKSFDLSDYE